MDTFSFERLEAYTKAIDLVTSVYSLADLFPSHEKFALGSQIRRAVVSVPSNIAESCGRVSYKEKIHFLEIAYGSLLETYCQLQIAVKVNYITISDFQLIKHSFFSVGRLINSLSKSYAKTLTPKSLNH